MEQGQLRQSNVATTSSRKRIVVHRAQRMYPSCHHFPPNKGQRLDVLRTTYHIVRNDKAKFCDIGIVALSRMMIDEAQCIKNHSALMAKAMKEVGNTIGHTRIAF